MYRIYVLEAFLEALYKALGGARSPDDPSRETTRLLSDIEEQPEVVREALTRWVRAKDCRLDDVPVILAAEAHAVELATELERAFYREKPGIMVAEGAGFRWLLDRLADKYETETGLADHLHVEMFTQLPGAVRRARKVRPLVLAQAVPVGLGRRYKEAVRAYLSGYAIACCVLCRAVVEAALKETLERVLSEQINLDFVTLSDLIGRATKVLPNDVVCACRHIKSLGDKAAHQDAVLNLDEAYQALTAAQQVLKSVFTHPIGRPSRA
jgi:HEPN domain-containing protein